MIRCLILGLAVALCGCGSDGPALTEVEGVLTLDGKPVKGANLVFIPQNVPARSPSYGHTDAEGRFRLQFTVQKFGAMPATHHVQVEIPKPAPEEKQDGPLPKVPRKYLKEGSLTAEVKDGKNFIELKLTSD